MFDYRERIANRSQWISKFVSKRGEKLIFPPIGIFRRLFGNACDLRLAANTVGSPPQQTAEQHDFDQRSHRSAECRVI